MWKKTFAPGNGGGGRGHPFLSPHFPMALIKDSMCIIAKTAS